MILNPDGTYTIKNSATGETKTVSASDLPQYGLSPTGSTGPDYNAALDAKVKQPVVQVQGEQLGNQGTALSNSEKSLQLPAVKAQSDAVTKDIPVNQSSASLPPITTSANTNNIRDTYRQEWQNAKTTAERDAIATSYKTATGNDLLSAVLKPDTVTSVNTLLAAKQQVGIIKDGLNSDPKLKNYVGNPIWSAVISNVLKLPGGPALIQDHLGLNDKGMAALSGFTKLQGLGDRNSVGGRLSGYMIDFFNKAQPGLDRKMSDNLNQLNTVENQTNKYLDFYAKQDGFKDWSDVPGSTPFQTSSTSKAPTSWDDIINKKY